MPPTIDKKQIRTAIAKRLRQLRAGEQLTQIELGKRIGVSQNAVFRWEKGKVAPRSDDLYALCLLYGIPADDLIGLPDCPNPDG